MSPRLRVPTAQPRPIPRSLWRGFRQLCPACGIGASMEGYLGVRGACAHCGEKLGHIKADDGPAYFTVLVAGHVTVPLVLAAEQAWHPHMAVLMVAALSGLGLLIWRLLPRMKGAVLALMWALGLKGDEVQGDVEGHG
ncbi:MAG: DUF983 domain-containing protein [Magnetospirillum sp.]|nr:DUF983 domain-containing protein [Magnetospirillum sp.]